MPFHRCHRGRRPRTCDVPAATLTEALEPRRLLSGELSFAVIGDSSAAPATGDVANLIHGWNPAFVVSVGDINYPHGEATTIDANVGQYYHAYLAPYAGAYGAGSADGKNHFFPAIGDHDAENLNAYLDYFTLPGNERYYQVQEGNVGVFVVDTWPAEPDGTAADSPQAQWLKGALAASPAKWKFVFLHHAPFSSGANGSTARVQWPFAQWGASAVFSGHDHDYERLSVGGLTYFVNGLGGQSIFEMQSPVPGSRVRYNVDYGAMRVTTSDDSATFQFVARSGQVVDTYTIGAPVPPTGLNISPDPAGGGILLSWQGSPSDNTAYKVERSTDGVTFSQILATPVGATLLADVTATPGTTYSYRVRATNPAGDSAVVGPVTGTAPVGVAPSFLSDLPWVTAAGDWGPVERDASNGGPSPGDGRPLMLNGAVYPKGLGTHALSEVVYDLAGKYQRFTTDVGVDDESFGTAQFQVLADGAAIFDSGAMGVNSPTARVDVNVQGVRQLVLRVLDTDDGINGDHADWAGARLYAAPVPPDPGHDTGLPTIKAVVAARRTVARKGPIRLTAMGVAAGRHGAVTTAAFYRDSNGNGAWDPGDVLVQADASPRGGWAGTFSASELSAGTSTFFARVRDAAGAWSLPAQVTVVVANSPPKVGRLTARRVSASGGVNQVLLTAAGVRDGDGAVASVRFFRDDNQNGVWDPADALLADLPGRGTATWRGAVASQSQATQWFFAVATDKDGASSAAAPAKVSPAPHGAGGRR
jgi:hypothetical protein